MILGFYPQFIPHIVDGTKIHTIRADRSRRWRTDKERVIYVATGVCTKAFKEHAVLRYTGWQRIDINPVIKTVRIDGGKLSSADIERLAINDGFPSSEEFWYWFKDGLEDGTIIHWSEHRY